MATFLMYLIWCLPFVVIFVVFAIAMVRSRKNHERAVEEARRNREAMRQRYLTKPMTTPYSRKAGTHHVPPRPMPPRSPHAPPKPMPSAPPTARSRMRDDDSPSAYFGRSDDYAPSPPSSTFHGGGGSSSGAGASAPWGASSDSGSSSSSGNTD